MSALRWIGRCHVVRHLQARVRPVNTFHSISYHKPSPSAFLSNSPAVASNQQPQVDRSSLDYKMSCPFCMIAAAAPPSNDPAIINSPRGSAYPVLSTPIVVAFLDIAPLSPGHLLVCPRRHAVKSSEITVVESTALGFWLPVLTRAVLKSVGTTPEEASWNILQANGMCL